MATSKTKNISTFFGPAKRLRVDAEANASLTSRIEPDAGSVHELSKTASVTKKVRQVSTTAKGSDGFDLYPLPGFEPPPFRGVNQQQQSALQETPDAAGIVQELKEEAVPAEEKGPEMTKELKMRMELNKTIARAKRNLRTCEEHIAECQRLGRSFPDFQNLLVEQSWLEVVQDEFMKQYMETLHTFVQQESAGKLPVYPPLPLIFNAFNTCPFDKVKVVIIGQDPYHGPGQAMGLSFSVPKGTKIPSSLINIFKEIRDDVGTTIPSHGNLEKWAHQGVLLLNAVLTVREHHANSHAKKGWEPFTDAVIRAVSQKRKGVVFLLWGNSAQDKTRLIDTKQHHVLKAAHPSGLSAHKGFFNCRHFSKTNQILEKAGELPIDWQL
ncbi:unnamed protein product [Calypogeia fissa]